MRMRAVASMVLVLMTLGPWPALTPAARAQGSGAPPAGTLQPGAPQPGAPEGPQPRADYPGAAQIDTIPPEAMVLSLQETIRQAIANNLNIAISRYNPILAATTVEFTSANFDPLLTGSATVQDTQSRFIGSFGDSTSKDHSNAFSSTWTDPLTIGGAYNLNVKASDDTFDFTGAFPPPFGTQISQPSYNTSWSVGYTQSLLRNFGRQVNLWPIVVAQKNLDISESAFRQSVITTVTGAVEAYADLNFAIMQLRTARVSLNLAQDFLDENRIKVRVGTLAPIEITQAEAQVADREEQVIIFESALRLAEDNVRTEIGMRKDSPDWTRPVRPSDPLTLKEYAPTEAEGMDAAMTHRPDVAQARLNIEARETTLRARQTERRWDLNFTGSYGNQGFADSNYPDSYHDLTQQNQTTWTAALALGVPIGNRTALSNYNRAQADLDQSRYIMEQVEQGVRLDVRNAVRQVETTLKRVKSGQTNVRLQREKLAAEQKKFENGMSTSFQVLSFQNDLSSAETRENLATADYNKALAEMLRAMGTSLDYFGILLENDQPAQGGAPPAASRRPSRPMPVDLAADPGLCTADHVAEGVRLPTDFVLADGKAQSRSAFSALTDWTPKDSGSTGGR
ncbi:MAG TPA: TolC family protein [Patescibacteria group bacterium]|nr:TolC family protein [Patescibacteria group bacterium]